MFYSVLRWYLHFASYLDVIFGHRRVAVIEVVTLAILKFDFNLRYKSFGLIHRYGMRWERVLGAEPEP